MRISDFIQLANLALFFLTSIALSSSPVEHFSGFHLFFLVVQSYGLNMLIIHITRNTTLFPLVTTVVLLHLIFYEFRLIFIILDPTIFDGWYLSSLNVISLITPTLMFIVVGKIFFFLGICFGGLKSIDITETKKNRNADLDKLSSPEVAVFLTLAIIVIYSITKGIIFDDQRYSPNIGFKIIDTFLSLTITMALSLSIVVKRLVHMVHVKKYLITLIILVATYYFLRIESFSKGGLFFAGLMIVAAVLVHHGNKPIPTKFLAAISASGILVAVAAILSYDIGADLRIARMYAPHYFENQNVVYAYFSMINDNFNASDYASVAQSKLVPGFITRLNGFDSTLAVFNMPRDGSASFSLFNDLKAIVNFLVPGKLFDVILSSQYLGIQAYNIHPDWYFVDDIYTNFSFGLYGQVLAYAGYWLSPPILFIVGVCINRVYKYLQGETEWQKGIQVLFLFYLKWWVVSYGVDWITIKIIEICFSIALIFLITKSISVFKIGR